MYLILATALFVAAFLYIIKIVVIKLISLPTKYGF
jgi:hypothetical protein